MTIWPFPESDRKQWRAVGLQDKFFFFSNSVFFQSGNVWVCIQDIYSPRNSKHITWKWLIERQINPFQNSLFSAFETNILPEESSGKIPNSFKSLRGSSTILREVCFCCLFAPLKTFWQNSTPKIRVQLTNYQLPLEVSVSCALLLSFWAAAVLWHHTCGGQSSAFGWSGGSRFHFFFQGKKTTTCEFESLRVMKNSEAFFRNETWKKSWDIQTGWWQLKYVFGILTPEPWGPMIQFDEHILKKGLVQPPTSKANLWDPRNFPLNFQSLETRIQEA